MYIVQYYETIYLFLKKIVSLMIIKLILCWNLEAMLLKTRFYNVVSFASGELKQNANDHLAKINKLNLHQMHSDKIQLMCSYMYIGLNTILHLKKHYLKIMQHFYSICSSNLNA